MDILEHMASCLVFSTHICNIPPGENRLGDNKVAQLETAMYKFADDIKSNSLEFLAKIFKSYVNYTKVAITLNGYIEKLLREHINVNIMKHFRKDNYDKLFTFMFSKATKQYIRDLKAISGTYYVYNGLDEYKATIIQLMKKCLFHNMEVGIHRLVDDSIDVVPKKLYDFALAEKERYQAKYIKISKKYKKHMRECEQSED